MKLLGVVVTYYPDQEVVENIKTYFPVLDGLIVWDNTPESDKRTLDFSILNGEDKLILQGTGKNEGIGKALNNAVRYAQTNGFTHLLTMDQDSSWKKEMARSYVNAIFAYGENEMVIFSTNYFIRSQQNYYYPLADAVTEVSSAMTSGSVYPIALFQQIGVFMENLFVWGIDCEFSWRAKRNNIKTVCFRYIVLEHNLGYQKKKRHLFGKEVFPNEYGPARSYYNVRNGIFLHKSYPEFLNLRSHLFYHLFKRSVFIVLYEEKKLKKLKALIWGIIHGMRSHLGECQLKF